MKRKTFYLLPLALLMLFAAGCRENEIRPELPGLDSYEGYCDSFTMTDATKNLRTEELVCHIRAKGGAEITRKVRHQRLEGVSTFTFETGIKDGEYTLLYFERDSSRKFGLGAKVLAENERIKVLTEYNSTLELFGEGTEDEPYNITCEEDLGHLMAIVNEQSENDFITNQTHFKQIANLDDMYSYSFGCNQKYGWAGIGCHTSPFISIYDGGGYTINGVWGDNVEAVGLGLFGYAMGAQIRNVKLRQANFIGASCVGGVVGVVMTPGNKRTASLIENCSVRLSKINIDTDNNGNIDTFWGIGVGGIVGGVDDYAMVLMHSDTIGRECQVAGSWSVGGILGGGMSNSTVFLEKCINEGAPIYSGYSSAGGIVGSADTSFIYACNNAGNVQGQIQNDSELGNVGAGGILGGSGKAKIAGCFNSGNIIGHKEVGGIVGSSLFSETQYNDVMVTTCGNKGNISGDVYIGGICGQAQLGAFGCYNEGVISSQDRDSFVGGILGGASLAFIQYCANYGTVKGNYYTGGLTSQVMLAVISASQNFGEVQSVDGPSGGIIGRTGSESVIHYCSNYGLLSHKGGEGCVGGIAGEVGLPKEWTGWQIADCVFAGLHILITPVSIGLALVDPYWGRGGKILKFIGYVVSYGEKLIEGLLLTGDAVLLGDVIVESVGANNSSRINDELKADLSLIYNQVTDYINTTSEKKISGGSYNFPNGINKESLLSQHSYQKELLNFFNDPSESFDNSTQYDCNLAYVREQRLERNEAIESSTELIHNIISGVVLVASTAILLGSTCMAVIGTIATAGTGAAVAAYSIGVTLACIGGIVSIAGGLNSITKDCLDFADNASVVSQCLNAGPISREGGNSCTGGIIGLLQEQCLLENCVNVGELSKGTNGSGIIGRIGSHVEFNYNINIGKGWEFGIANGEGVLIENEECKSNYYLEGTASNNGYGQAINIEQLCTQSTFDKDWLFGDQGRWIIPKSSSGYFPVPYQSEMQYDKF